MQTGTIIFMVKRSNFSLGVSSVPPTSLKQQEKIVRNKGIQLLGLLFLQEYSLHLMQLTIIVWFLCLV